jgi:gliding motility-associated-like protein
LRRDSTVLPEISSCNAVDTGWVRTPFLNFLGCDSFVYQHTRLLTTDVATITGKLDFCIGLQTVLNASAGTAVVTYAWSTGSTMRSIVVNNGATYSVTVTNSVGCKSIATVRTIAYAIPQVVSISAPICEGGEYTLSSGKKVRTAGVHYDMVRSYHGCDSVTKLTLTVLKRSRKVLTQYVCKLEEVGMDSTTSTNHVGCDSVTVTKRIYDVANCLQDLPIPTAIIPDGDGQNDVWFIPNIERLQPNHLIIRNKRGIKVYEMHNYQNTWSGRDMNDNPLTAGIYDYLFYVTDSTTGKQTLKTGHIRIYY